MPATGDPGGIWPQWNYIYTTYSSTAGSTLTLNSTDPWPYWNAGYTNGTLLYTEVSSGTTLITGPQWQNWNLRYEQAAEYTAEQRAAQEERRRLVDAQQAEWRRQRETERARQAVVNSRAEELLLSLLNDEQAAPGVSTAGSRSAAARAAGGVSGIQRPVRQRRSDAPDRQHA